MTQATVHIPRIGAVAVDAPAGVRTINLVGAIAADGSFVNVRTLRVSRNAKAAKEASRYDAYDLVKVSEGHYMLMQIC